MKKNLILMMLMCIGTEVWAGEGHDHGNSAFLGAKTSNVFVLSETQIENLDLKTTKVQRRIFYETVELPAVIKKSSVLDDALVVHGYLSEQAEVLKLKKGQEVSLKVDAFPKKKFIGKMIRTESEMNPKTGFFTVVAQIENIPGSLAGFKGVLTIRVSEKEKEVAVPLSALQGTFGDYFVFVKEGEHFTKTPVVIGHKSEGWQEVVHGVHLGQEIVTQGSYQLQYVTGMSEDEHDHEDRVSEERHSDHDHDAEERHSDHDHDAEERHSDHDHDAEEHHSDHDHDAEERHSDYDHDAEDRHSDHDHDAEEHHSDHDHDLDKCQSEQGHCSIERQSDYE